MLYSNMHDMKVFFAPTTLNCELDLLPDDVLSEIFVVSATELEERVALSLVCKQFRAIMMSMRKMWNVYRIASYHSPEQIIAIAEGSRFVSLKAYITLPSFLPSSVKTQIANRGLDLEEYGMRYYKFAVELILSFGPEELELGVDDSHREEIEPILSIWNTQNLRLLVWPGTVENSAGARLLERWDLPLLRHLEVEFVPRAALRKSLVQCSLDCRKGTFGETQTVSLREFLAAARSLQDLQLFLPHDTYFYEVCDLPSLRSLQVNFGPHPSLAKHLVRCDLLEIGEAHIDSLKEFLTVAKSLQDLRLFLLDETGHFYEICDLPSLQSLEVNFEPHTSFARHLIRFRLCPPSSRPLSLSRMLDFLSSSVALQELTIESDDWSPGFFEGPGTIDASPVVTLPRVISWETCGCKSNPVWVAKLRMPILRTLKLGLVRLDNLSTVIRNEFRTSLQSMLSLEDLELRMFAVTIDGLEEIIRYAPPHLESFSLKECKRFNTDEVRQETPRAPRRKLIRFMGCHGFFLHFMPAFIDHLKAIDLGGIKLQFSDCTGCKDGTFGLDDVMSEWIDPDASRNPRLRRLSCSAIMLFDLI